MKTYYSALFFLWLAQGYLGLLTVNAEQCFSTQMVSGNSGVINQQRDVIHVDCYKIKVPSGYYVRIRVEELNFRDKPCGEVYLKISSGAASRTFCSRDSSSLPEDLLFLGEVKVVASLAPEIREQQARNSWRIERISLPVDFKLSYSLESITCAQDDHFRCSEHQCVDKNLVCNGIKDCENGKDEDGCAKGIAAVSGVNSSRVDVASKIKSRRSTNFGWGDNTHRSILALFLAGEEEFSDNSNLEEELMKKELELKFLLALLGNSTDTLPVSELGIFVNALTVTCHNTRQFYGHDLLQTLGSRVVNAVTPLPGASLALCNSNWTLPAVAVRRLLRILDKESDYLFVQDIQGMAVMALTCIHKKTSVLDTIANATETYDAMIEKFIDSQNPDGSFGNVYTTAIIAQALLASGQESNTKWNITGTVKYLMKEISQSTDLLASYFVVPVFNNRTLLDVSNRHCVKTKNYTGNGAEDLVNKLGRKVHVQYSLYIGDQKDVVHTIFLRVPEKSSAYDVMRIAQENDGKYNFSSRSSGNHLYVYSIAGIFNDPEAQKFWLLYTTDSKGGEPVLFTKSPDKLIVRSNQHLVMWFRTVPSLQSGDETNEEEAEVETETDKGAKEDDDKRSNSSVEEKKSDAKFDGNLSGEIDLFGLFAKDFPKD